MTFVTALRATLRKLGDSVRSSIPGYRFVPNDDFKPPCAPQRNTEMNGEGFCSTCGSSISRLAESGFTSFHNAVTCRLVNIALSEMGVSFDQMIRVDVYPDSGPLKGYYSSFEPFTIHVAQEAYSLYPEYIIFHETKHLVDCATKGWSEEHTPDPFARDLCAKYGYRCPPYPPHQQVGLQFGQSVGLNSTFTH